MIWVALAGSGLKQDLSSPRLQVRALNPNAEAVRANGQWQGPGFSALWKWTFKETESGETSKVYIRRKIKVRVNRLREGTSPLW